MDPPSQSLWLRPHGGEEIQLQRLSPDQDWCDTIVWSGDSSVITFLVQDGRLVVADSVSAQVVLERWLVDPPRGYPPQEIVTDLVLSEDGSVASYRRCSRESGACSALEKLTLADHRGESDEGLSERQEQAL